MKRNYPLALVLVLCLFITLFDSCSKDGSSNPISPSASVPTLTTNTATNITSTSAQMGGTISSDGGSAVTARGVCWTNGSLATIADSKTIDGSGIGTFTSALTNLTPNSLYSVRAYATNSAGTAYGTSLFLITPQNLTVPTVTTMPPDNIKSTSVNSGGEVTASGNATVTARGICWSTSPNPTIANSTAPYLTGGLGTFSSYTFSLTVHTTYYIRAYATNSVGTGYGQEYSFRTVYTIGEALGGGRIFYLDATNNHGLITALADQSGGAKWNHTSNPYSNINAYSYTNGAANTTNIIAAIGSAGNAAGVCRTYTGGGFNDWYLPSRDELNLLYAQKSIIGNFQAFYYWSSTASSTYNASAWSQEFGSGMQSNISDKTYLYFVRAIRAF